MVPSGKKVREMGFGGQAFDKCLLVYFVVFEVLRSSDVSDPRYVEFCVVREYITGLRIK